MVVRYLGDSIYKCLAADIKPSNAIPNAMLIETDTRKTYYYQSGVWTEESPTIPPTSNIGNTAYTIYIAGTLVKARNNRTGLVPYSEDNDTITTANAFNNAINDIQNIPNIGLHSRFGASVQIMAGLYKCRSTIINDRGTGSVAAERIGISLKGEGASTIIQFTPTSTLADGIMVRSRWADVREMTLTGNSNTTNLLAIRGEASTYNGVNYNRNDGGIISGIQFHGANSNMINASGTGGTNGINDPGPVAGQTGILFDAGDPGFINKGATFFWKIRDCSFVGLAYGIDAKGQLATTIDLVGCDFFYNNVGGRFEQIEHNICNTRFDGSVKYGDIGFWFRPSDDWNPSTGQGGIAGLTSVSNMSFEMWKAGSTAIYIERPDGLTAGPGNIHISTLHVSNFGDNLFDNFAVVDEQPAGNFDYINMSPYRPVKTVRRFGFTTGQVGALTIGTEQYNNGYGIMAPPNVRENGSGIISQNDVDGMNRILDISGLAQASKSIQWVQAHHTRPSNMKLNVKFKLSAASSIRAFIGLIRTGNVTPPTLFPKIGDDTGTPTAITDILNGIPGIGLWLDTAISLNWRILYNDGNGAGVPAAMSTPKAADTSYHVAEIITHDPTSRFSVNYDKVKTIVGAQPDPSPTPADNGRMTTDIVTTDIPASGDRIGWIVWMQDTGTGSRIMRIFHIDMETFR